MYPKQQHPLSKSENKNLENTSQKLQKMATATTVVEPPSSTLSEKVNAEMPGVRRSTTKFSWEDGPMQLMPTPFAKTGATDQYTRVASEMTLIHNCLIRALNSIYIQAPHIPITEFPNFISYCLATYQGLCKHHDSEETILFPAIEKLTGTTGLTTENVQGHRDFKEKLGSWGKWLESCHNKKNNFSAQICTSMMDDFMPLLAAHYAAEIPTLLALKRFDDKKIDLLALAKEEGEKVMGGMSKTRLLPVFLLNHDCTFENGAHAFPSVPAPVRWVLRSVCGRVQSAWWQFSTVGYDGNPRELKYLGQAN